MQKLGTIMSNAMAVYEINMSHIYTELSNYMTQTVIYYYNIIFVNNYNYNNYIIVYNYV